MATYHASQAVTVSRPAALTLRVFPSHTGHESAGNHIFNADLDCDGAAG